MTQPTPLYRLIDGALKGTSLADFVASRRRPTNSWREIAEEIQTETGVQVSEETLRLWFTERETADAA